MKEPDLIGPHGKAWRFNLEALEKKYGVHCALASWLVHCPWAHPLWAYYEVQLLHLRPTPAFPNPIVHLFGATHEICVSAISPDWTPTLDDRPMRLSPTNFVGHFIMDGDDSAVIRVELSVIDIINGRLNPDTDALRQWITEYGDHCIKPEYRSPR